jgi:signal transduction histidine kinase
VEAAQAQRGIRFERNKRVEISGHATAYADPIRVRQIIRNLLVNAWRYGGLEIRVALEERDNWAQVHVTDDGPGIPPEDRERVFEPYERAHHRFGQPASVGLGLTVSRQLARLMGGTLTYEYENGWSKFSLSLPRPPAGESR